VPADQSVLALAFNKSAADTLQQKIGDKTDCRTFHSYCKRQVERCFPKANLDPRDPMLNDEIDRVIPYGYKGDARALIS